VLNCQETIIGDIAGGNIEHFERFQLRQWFDNGISNLSSPQEEVPNRFAACHQMLDAAFYDSGVSNIDRNKIAEAA